jgi:hypothetical protein
MLNSYKSHTVKAGTRNVGQCKCLWCGQAISSEIQCIDDITKFALAAFAKQWGKQWKSQLKKFREMSEYPSGTIEPERLQSFVSSHTRHLDKLATTYLLAFHSRYLKETNNADI